MRKRDKNILFTPFLIQWHITERCNWNCLHCYRKRNSCVDLPLSDLKYILHQCLGLLEVLDVKDVRINIGGGEPFLREDIWDFIKILKKYKEIKLYIMTNGSLISKDVARALSKIKTLKGVQVSMEGLKETNDKIRGKGSFEKIERAIRTLVKYNIFTRVSVTLTKLNLEEIEPLVSYLKELGVNNVGIRRFVPVGKGEILKKYMLSPLETRDFYLFREELMDKYCDKNFTISYGCEDGLLVQEVEKISKKRRKYLYYTNCAVLRRRALTILDNGDILLCRRLPIKIGNVFEKNLEEIFFFSTLVQKMSNWRNFLSYCEDCPFFSYCLGGARCIAYGFFKKIDAPDPQCWRLFTVLPNSGII